jgi:predicted DNA-binding transcriptional regulator AlpA
MPPSSTTSATTGSLPASNFDTLPDGAYVRVPVVCAMYGVSTSTAWRMARDGRIPAATKISLGVTAWRVGDIRADLARRAAA